MNINTTLLLTALVARGAGQGPAPVPRSLVPPGVSCTAAQLEAGAKPDSNAVVYPARFVPARFQGRPIRYVITFGHRFQ